MPALAVLAPGVQAAGLSDGLVVHVRATAGKVEEIAGGQTAALVNTQGTILSGVVGDGSTRAPWAVAFDGDDDVVSTSRKLANSDQQTVAVWVRTHQPGGKLAGFESAPSGASSSYDRSVIMTDDGRVHALVYRSGAGWQIVSSIASLADGRWHLVASTFDGTTFTLFVDGAVTSQVTVNGGTYALSGYWRLGTGTASGLPTPPANPAFRGQIAALRVYGRALPAEEVTALTAAGPVDDAALWRDAVVPGVDIPALDEGLTLHLDPKVAKEGDTEVADLSTLAGSGSLLNMVDGTSGPVGVGTRAQPHAFGFDGVDDMIATSRKMRAPESFAISAWFRSTYTGGKLAGFETTQSGRSGNYDRVLYVTPEGRVAFGTYVPGQGAQGILSPPGQVDGAWHHAVGMKDGIRGQRLYLDGVLVAEDETNKTYPMVGYWRFGAGTIGSWPSPPANTSHRGMMGEIRIYDRPLLAEEVTQLVARGPDGLGPWQRPPVDLVSDLLLHMDTGAREGEVTFLDKGPHADHLSFIGGTPEFKGSGTTSDPRGVELDGIDDRLRSNQSRSAPDAFTYSIWVRADTPGAKLVGFETTADARSGNYDRVLYLSDDGRAHFGTYVAGKGSFAIADARNIADGGWHHIVATKGAQGGGPDGLRLFVDGKQVASDDTKLRYDLSGYWRVGEGTIGSYPNAPRDTWLDGAIASLRIYERALSVGEAAALHTLGPHGEAPAPAAGQSVAATPPPVSPTSIPIPSGTATPIKLTPQPRAPPQGSVTTATKRALAGGNAFLEYDGQTIPLIARSGCNPRAEVVESAPDATGVVRKQLARPTVEACVVNLSALSPGVRAWVTLTLEGRATPVDVSIIIADFDGRVQARVSLHEAVLARVEMPAPDAASKDAAHVALHVHAARATREEVDSAAVIGAKGVNLKWNVQSFRVSLSGSGTVFATRASAPAWERAADGALAIDPIVVTMAESRAAEWAEWAHRFLIEGSNGPTHERTLTIEYLAPNLQSTIATVTYTGVGVYGGDVFVSAPRRAEGVATRTFYLYAEGVTLE